MHPFDSRPSKADRYQLATNVAYLKSNDLDKMRHNDMASKIEDSTAIPYEVIESLPRLLRDGSRLLSTNHESGVFVTTALGVLSGCLPNVLGRHADGDMPLNLFAAVEAPAGSGKGALRYARKLGQGIDRRLRTKSLTEQGDWFQMQADRPSRDSDGSRPPIRSLFLSGNSSERGLLEALYNNKGTGVVLESEAITLAKLFGGVGGNSIDLLLKGFHNEPVSVTRKGDHLHIPQPAFSVVVTGTPETLKMIITGVESGLLSRFAIYSFTAAPEWKSHRPNEQTSDRDRFFDDAGDQIDRLYEMLDQRAVRGAPPLVVRLKDRHWDRIDEAFGAELANLYAAGMNPALEASVKRAAIVAFRITCILTVLRAFERNRKLKAIEELTATDADANTGLTLALLYLKHTLRVASRMSQNSFQPKDQRRARFLTALPDEFSTGTAVRIGETVQPPIPRRTVMACLDLFVNQDMIEKIRHGVYRKLEGASK
jgi:Protein of unknown function (DUF3987)